MGIISCEGKYLLLKKPDDFGVYAGTWGIPGGGVDDGELIEDAFVREMKEETGLQLHSIQPLFFSDDVTVKTMRDGTDEKLYMVYLYFLAEANEEAVSLDDEHVEYAWIELMDIGDYEINDKTKETFERLQDYV